MAATVSIVSSTDSVVCDSHATRAGSRSLSCQADSSSSRRGVGTTFTLTLPPAQDGDCPTIDDPRAMTDSERSKFARWLAQGAPEGNPAERRAAPAKDTLGPPSDRFPMAQSYTSQINYSDDYRCFLIDPKLTQTLAVAAVSVEPGNRAIVHHASVFAVPDTQVAAIEQLDAKEPGPGYTCFSGAGVAEAYPIGLWVPGYDSPSPPPRSTVGFYLPAGWRLVLQNHYNFANGRSASSVCFRSDGSTVRLKKTKRSTPAATTTWAKSICPARRT